MGGVSSIHMFRFWNCLTLPINEKPNSRHLIHPSSMAGWQQDVGSMGTFKLTKF